MLEDLQDYLMFQFIKCLFKVKFEDENLFSAMVTKMEKLKSPSQAAMYCSTLDEAILLWVDQL